MKKPINSIIAEYVERNDVGGLAAFFRAYLEDSMQKDLVEKACRTVDKDFGRAIKKLASK